MPSHQAASALRQGSMSCVSWWSMDTDHFVWRITPTPLYRGEKCVQLTGKLCLENLTAFHTQPGSGLNITKDEQQSQKRGHIFWKNQQVHSEESRPLSNLGLSLHICEMSVLQQCAEDCQNEAKGPEEHSTLLNPLMLSGSREPHLLEGE